MPTRRTRMAQVATKAAFMVRSSGRSEDYREQDKKKGNRNYAIPLYFLVAGPGFEPGTFGL